MRMSTLSAGVVAGLATTVLLAPHASAAPATDLATVDNVAHRGASAYAPENTLAAVREGIEMKADLIELDVQRSKDGELVLVHDTNLARTTDAEQVFPGRAPWRVSDLTYDEMLRLDAGSWKSAEYAGERIPTLREAVEVIRGSRSGMLLEIKAPSLYPGIEAEVAEDLRRFPGYVDSAVAADRLVVQSFDFGSMRTFTDLEPDVPVGLLGTPPVADLEGLATWADQVNPNHRSADAGYVAAVHDAGMECLVWTVDAPADMERALDLGVDGVITNKPDVLDQVMRDRLAPAA